jgi:hypothetical protein
VGHLITAVEDEEDPLYCVQASTIRVLQAVRAYASPGRRPDPEYLRGGAGGTDLLPLLTPRRAHLFYPAYLGVVETLHAVKSEHADSRPHSCDGEETPLTIQAAYEQLDAAVSQCSVQLVRQLYGEQVFRSPVVEFCALCAVTEHGN